MYYKTQRCEKNLHHSMNIIQQIFDPVFSNNVHKTKTPDATVTRHRQRFCTRITQKDHLTTSGKKISASAKFKSAFSEKGKEKRKKALIGGCGPFTLYTGDFSETPKKCCFFFLFFPFFSLSLYLLLCPRRESKQRTPPRDDYFRSNSSFSA